MQKQTMYKWMLKNRCTKRKVTTLKAQEDKAGPEHQEEWHGKRCKLSEMEKKAAGCTLQKTKDALEEKLENGVYVACKQ